METGGGAEAVLSCALCAVQQRPRTLATRSQYHLSKSFQHKVSPDTAKYPRGAGRAKLPWLRTTVLNVMFQGKRVNRIHNRCHWMLDSG